jgi:hypothetical protein
MKGNRSFNEPFKTGMARNLAAMPSIVSGPTDLQATGNATTN